MPQIETFPWIFLLLFLLLPITFVGIFLWFASSVFRRAAFGQERFGGNALDDDRRWDTVGGGEGAFADTGKESYGDYGQERDEQQGWRSFSFGPGLKTMLAILAISAFVTLVFAPRFFPGVILFLPLFWAGGWSRTFRFGPGGSRRSHHDGSDRPSSRAR